MTVLKASHHAWAPAFCAGCESIVHYQMGDVIKGRERVHAERSDNVFSVTCKCGHTIEIGRIRVPEQRR